MILKTFVIVAVSGVSALGGGSLDVCSYGSPYGPSCGVAALVDRLTSAFAPARYGHQRGGSVTDEEGFLDLLNHSIFDGPSDSTPYSTLAGFGPEEEKKVEAPQPLLRSERKLKSLKRKDFKSSFDPMRVDSPKRPNLREKGHVGQPAAKGRKRG